MPFKMFEFVESREEPLVNIEKRTILEYGIFETDGIIEADPVIDLDGKIFGEPWREMSMFLSIVEKSFKKLVPIIHSLTWLLDKMNLSSRLQKTDTCAMLTSKLDI